MLTMKQKLFLLLFFFIALGFSQKQIDMPDPNFEKALANLGYDSLPINGKIDFDEVSTIVFLDINSQNISNLTGIEHFTSLISLDCSNNKLKKLDVSKNTKLQLLYCYENNLEKVDVSKNKKLNYFWCGSNPLTEVDISNNKKLLYLDIAKTNIRIINLNKNGNLKKIWVHGMPNLIDFQAKNNSNLSYLYIYKNPRIKKINVRNNNNELLQVLESRSNKNLNCIAVDDIDKALNKKEWTKDSYVSFQRKCN